MPPLTASQELALSRALGQDTAKGHAPADLLWQVLDVYTQTDVAVCNFISVWPRTLTHNFSPF
jgi:hypothetical protein